MDFQIRLMQPKDKAEVISMMEVFYASDAVSTNGSPEIFEKDFDTCTGNSPYLEGYVFCCGDVILGYAMIAKSFSTEFGKPCIWLEDLYLKEEYRGQGVIPKFFVYIETEYNDSILRLEVEDENLHAVHVYKKCGFSKLPYTEMKKEISPAEIC